MRTRVDAWFRWLRVPWSQAAVAIALVGAAAAPALLIAAADVWQVAAGDEFAQRLVGDLSPAESGVTVQTNAQFDAGAMATADALVAGRIAAIDGLTDPVRTMWTTRETGELGPDAVNPGIPFRVMARPGAIEALTVVESDPSIAGGVWISDYIAERTGARVGDLVAYASALEPEDPAAEFAPGEGASVWPIVGIYEALWSRDGPAPGGYWGDVPADLLPRYLSVFNAPDVSLLILDEDTMAGSGLTGFAQWDAPSASPPARVDALRSRVDAYADLERALVDDEAIGAALADLAAFRPARPAVESRLGDALVDVEEAVAELDQPLAAARTAGVLVGLAVMVAGAVFAVHRRRTEYRLLAGEGERWPVLSARTAGQLLAPVSLGTAIGVVAGVYLADRLGPAADLRFGAVDPSLVIRVALVGLVGASLVTGLLAQRTLDRGILGGRRSGIAVPIVGLMIGITALLWFQVARIPSRRIGIDLAVVILPIAALVAAVAVVVALLGAVAPRGRFVGGRLPTPLFLAWRRTTRNDLGSALIVGALAVGIGLVAMSAILVSSLDRNIDVKLTTTVGAETMAELVSLPDDGPDLPPGSTIMSFDPARIQPGNQPVRVIAVDPATYADVVTWPTEFGSSAHDVIARLDDGVEDGRVPVVAVDNVPAPPRGAFGAQRIPYRIVATVASAPIAYEFGPTFLVSVDRLDAFVRERLAGQLDVPVDDPAVDARFTSPTDGYRQVLVTQSSEDAVRRFIDAADIRARVIESRTARANAVEVVAPAVAFDYLRVLGWVAAAAAIAALVLHLASLRSQRAVASLMTRRMGLSPGRSSLATALEVVALSIVAIVTAFAVIPVVARRLLPRFDPAPQRPPAAAISADLLVLAIAVLAAVAVVGIVVWALETSASRRTHGEVLRASE